MLRIPLRVCSPFASTNPVALNYNAIYTVDDGSCLIVGCMDPSQPNYNPAANIQIPCASGGRRRVSSNRDVASPATNSSSQGCCPLEGATNFEPGCACCGFACVPDLACCTFPVRGCDASSAVNGFSARGAAESALCVSAVEGCVVPHGTLNFDSNANRMGRCVWQFLGCTDASASNFVPIANVDDGTCQRNVSGCTNPLASNFDSRAMISAPCEYEHLGCTDPTAANFMADATASLPSECMYALRGCTVPQAVNYDSRANVDDGSCQINHDKLL